MLHIRSTQFPPCHYISSVHDSRRHDIADILLKVALSTTNQSITTRVKQSSDVYAYFGRAVTLGTETKSYLYILEISCEGLLTNNDCAITNVY